MVLGFSCGVVCALNGSGGGKNRDVVPRRRALAILASLGAAGIDYRMRGGGDAVVRAEAEYDRYADQYDGLETSALASALGLEDLRRLAVGQASGNVLELAVGTGINLSYFDPSKVETYLGVDVSAQMLNNARTRSSSINGKKAFRLADATKLPFSDSGFDTVLDTYSLCTFDDPLAALMEAKRVCKDKGKIILVEHVRSDKKLLAAYQNTMAGVVKAASKGCLWNQDLDSMLESAGIRVLKSQRYLSGTVQIVIGTPSST